MNEKFELSALEADIEKLSKEIIEKRNLLEHKELSERELVKQALHPIIKQPVNRQSSVNGQGPTAGSQVLPDYLKDSSPEIKLQVEKFVHLVFHQGIEKTAAQASQSGDFILDAFHDALTDKLYEELRKRKMI